METITFTIHKSHVLFRSPTGLHIKGFVNQGIKNDRLKQKINNNVLSRTKKTKDNQLTLKTLWVAGG